MQQPRCEVVLLTVKGTAEQPHTCQRAELHTALGQAYHLCGCGLQWCQQLG